MLDDTGRPLVSVRNLKMHFPIYGGLLRRRVGEVQCLQEQVLGEVGALTRDGDAVVRVVRDRDRVHDLRGQRRRGVDHPERARAQLVDVVTADREPLQVLA